MRSVARSSASHALAAVLLTTTGCTLSADLDSLTSGGGAMSTNDAGQLGDAPPDERTTSHDPPDGGVHCSPGDCAPAPSNSRPESSTDAPNVDASTRTPTPDETGSGESRTSDTRRPDAPDGDTSSETMRPTSAPDPAATTSSDGAEATNDSTDSSDALSATSPSNSAPMDDTDGSAILVHRYQFTDVTTAIVDDIGDADGVVVGAATGGDGRLEFDGETYVELPPDVVAGRQDVTLEVWFTSYHTRSWERVFDIGQSDDGDGQSYLFLTPQSTAASRTMRVTFRAEGEAEVTVDSELSTSDDLETHVAVVFDASGNEIRLYHNGELSAWRATEGSLQDVDVAKVWLGRSLFDGDPLFEGNINELRIYDGTLGASYVRESFQAGPDALAP